MFCPISPVLLPARERGPRGVSGVGADCLPVLLSICQFYGRAGRKGGEMESFVHVYVCACVCVHVCVHGPGAGVARHRSRARQTTHLPSS